MLVFVKYIEKRHRWADETVSNFVRAVADLRAMNGTAEIERHFTTVIAREKLLQVRIHRHNLRRDGVVDVADDLGCSTPLEEVNSSCIEEFVAHEWSALFALQSPTQGFSGPNMRTSRTGRASAGVVLL